uniref:Uncharacterized protein n=1 Tax=Oryza sativa subsp. japonica TaxID=39947 RepID=Q2QV20_ORYSJ|nr:hypothetical protein LOC_Os12g14320 [Oryza sativa Japonica Group]
MATRSVVGSGGWRRAPRKRRAEGRDLLGSVEKGMTASSSVRRGAGKTGDDGLPFRSSRRAPFPHHPSPFPYPGGFSLSLPRRHRQWQAMPSTTPLLPSLPMPPTLEQAEERVTIFGSAFFVGPHEDDVAANL